MSHFGRSGPPDIRDTYSLLVLNITFRTSADDLFPLFDKYGKVVDVFIPRDRRTGESRGFAFVRYKYADEAQKAVEKLDGKIVDGREIMVQFAKYGPNAERIHKGRIIEASSKSKEKSRSRSPRPRGNLQVVDVIDIVVVQASVSVWVSDVGIGMNIGTGITEGEVAVGVGSEMIVTGIVGGKEIIAAGAGAGAGAGSASPDHHKDRGRGRYDDERRSRSRSYDRSPSPRRTPRGESPDANNHNEGSPVPKTASPNGRPVDSRSPSPRRSDADE
uniref:RRM domain-containing protein n=1 Tax=Fagus sylvatica TaxID=28930 RepID=A0A2N9FA46_FAGSY